MSVTRLTAELWMTRSYSLSHDSTRAGSRHHLLAERPEQAAGNREVIMSVKGYALVPAMAKDSESSGSFNTVSQTC